VEAEFPLSWEPYFVFCFFVFLVLLEGFELRALCLLAGILPLESLHQPSFVLGIFSFLDGTGV
jgi:hypothetical protein